MLPYQKKSVLYQRRIFSYSVYRISKEGASWFQFLLGFFILSIYTFFFSENRSILFVTSAWSLGAICIIFVLAERPRDTLTPAKIATLLYTASFSIAPLWLASLGAYHIPYFGRDVESLLGITAAMTVLGYLFFLLGYFIVTRIRNSGQMSQVLLSQRQTRYTIFCAMVLAVLGMTSYSVLVINSGGLGRLLGYSGGRADIFAGVYGGWFWGIHLLFAAYGLFAIVAIQKHPWLCLILALCLAVAFTPLQGRDIVVAPIFCWLLFYHGLHKPLRWRNVLIGTLTIILLGSLVGAFRSGNIRDDFGNFLSTFIDRAGYHLTEVISQNIEQLDTAMTSVRYIEKGNATLGPMVLMAWAEPLDRALLGDIIPSIDSSVFIDLLLIPEHKGWNTATSPSLPGELYLSLGWFGVIIGMTVYGSVFALFMRWYDTRGRNPILYAAYPFVVFMVSKMIIDGTLQAFRPILVLSVVLVCTIFSPSNNENKHIKVRYA